ASSSVSLAGAGGASRSMAPGETVTNLVPGRYTLTAAPVTAGTDVYAATPAAQDLTVNASLAPVQATVAYAVATAALAVNVGGLPTGMNALVTLAGPAGFARTLTAGATLT